MRGRGTVLAVVTAAGLVAAACTGTGSAVDRSGGVDLGAGQLHRIAALTPFGACDDFLGWVKAEARSRVQPWGLPGVGGSAVDTARGLVRASAAASALVGSAVEQGAGPATTTAAPAAATPATPAASSSAAGPGADQPASGSPAPGAPAFSATNVQEQGVDEPDVLKTDGRRLVTVVGTTLHVLDVSGGTPSELGSLDLGADAGAGARLLLAGARVLVISQEGGLVWRPAGVGVAPGGADAEPDGLSLASARLTAVDISDPAAPRTTATLRVEGSFVDARLVETTARIVLRSDLTKLPFVAPTGPASEERARQANLDVIEQSTAEQWLPAYVLERGDGRQTGQLVPCNRVNHPAAFGGFSTVSVLTVDLGASLTPGDAIAVIGDGQRVYASAEHLFVAADHPADHVGVPEGPEPADEPATTAAQPPAATSEPAAASTATDIHELSIAGTGPAAYVASGQVRGRLLDDFAMSEHDGVLRVATTDGWPAPGGSSESMVTTLSRQGDELVTLSQLGGLGRGEQIQAVRFVGATGFVVTYRQTDPLYVVDLSDPARPQARGELQLLGFSAYLHPIGDGRLLGIGQDATAEGRRTGAQVALFDVSDLDAPRLVAKAALPQGWSEVEQDYHAFLWWAPTRLAGVPMQLYGEPGGGEPFSGLVAFTVSPEQLSETGRIAHPAPSGPDPCTGGPPPEPGESRGSVTGDGPVTVPAAGATAAVPAVGAPTAVAPAMPPLLCAPWTAAPAITRAVVVGDTLYTLSVAGVMSTSLADLTQTGYVPFG